MYAKMTRQEKKLLCMAWCGGGGGVHTGRTPNLKKKIAWTRIRTQDLHLLEVWNYFIYSFRSTYYGKSK